MFEFLFRNMYETSQQEEETTGELEASTMKLFAN